MRDGGKEPLERDAPGDAAEGERVRRNVISSLRDIPAVGRYLSRINAEPRSLTTAAAREHAGRYWRDRAVIRLNKATAEITVEVSEGEDRAEFVPTDVELANIQADLAGRLWPELQPLHEIIDAPEQIQLANREAVFEFRGDDEMIHMIQLRVEMDGKKSYFPWTYWTDGVWRQMEPDGPLPLWGADQLKHNSVVYLHEGAKAARAVTRMLADPARLAAHPWGPDLCHAAHCGWIGGALSPHRTDWSVLARNGITQVFIVADHDLEGDSAIPKIARLLASYPITVIAIRVDDRFPVGFDLADPFPAGLFEKSADGRDIYCGPTFRDCWNPATFATRLGPPSQSPRPIYLRREFEREWIMVAGEGKAIFINQFDRSRLYTEEAFNNAVRPLSDTARTSELFKQQAYPQHVKAIAYEPGDEEGVITVEGDRSINTWTSSRIRSVEGDPKPWLSFMEHLFPNAEDRLKVMKWCATLIARPRQRMRYGLLLASTMQGVGKTTLCEILRVLVGEKNCRSPSANDVVESQFNSWIVRKRFVFVNEIYEGGSWRAYQKLKSCITDQTLEANEKMIRAYSVRNWAHFILCSNSEVPLSVEDDDRRFLVPEVTEQKRPTEVWTEFYAWLAGGGYAIVAGWAERFVKEHGAVEPGDEAPDSARKRALIEDSRCSEEIMVRSIADVAKDRGGQVILVENEIVAWIKNRTERQFKPSTVRGWLRKAGLFISKERLKVDGQKTRVAGVRPVDGADGWPALAPHRIKPDDLEAM